jgi:hypothetical protein
MLDLLICELTDERARKLKIRNCSNFCLTSERLSYEEPDLYSHQSQLRL